MTENNMAAAMSIRQHRLMLILSSDGRIRIVKGYEVEPIESFQ